MITCDDSSRIPRPLTHFGTCTARGSNTMTKYLNEGLVTTAHNALGRNHYQYFHSYVLTLRDIGLHEDHFKVQHSDSIKRKDVLRVTNAGG